MGRMLLITILAVVACARDVPPPPVATARPAVGLVGDWLRVAPDSLRGDTLILRADSTALGVVPWQGRLAIIKRWKIVFTSHDSVAARSDWAQGHADGGDGECYIGDTTGCISAPIICLGAGKQFQCEAFKYSPDSLTLSHGSRFVRLSHHPTAAREAL